MSSDHTNQDHPHRRNMRLRHYDYTHPGAYFITICTQGKKCLLGDIIEGQMHLNSYGQIVSRNWLWLPRQYPYITLDKWIIMPNHLHGIIIFKCEETNQTTHPLVQQLSIQRQKRKPLGRIIGAFKTVSTKEINHVRQSSGCSFWQRNFFEHIIRNENSLNQIREYITTNPLKWQLDQENPDYHGNTGGSTV
jgi:REP element-mobilizing transposase RayT